MENPPERAALSEQTLEALLQRLDQRLDAMQRHQHKLERDVEQVYKQTEALLWLMTQIRPRLPLPSMRAWAISPDFASILAAHMQYTQPGITLELGGGISTLVAGYVLEQIGVGKLISVDHSAEFSMLTRQNVERHGLKAWIDFIHAPLEPMRLAAETWEWYTCAALEALPMVDLLVVDGPVQQDNPQRLVRYPALPVLFDRLKSGAHLLVDDADRDDERLMVERWLREYPSQLTLVQTYFTEKGAKLLQKR